MSVQYRVIEMPSSKPMGQWQSLEEARRWLEYLEGQQPETSFGLEDDDPRSTDEIIAALGY